MEENTSLSGEPSEEQPQPNIDAGGNVIEGGLTAEKSKIAGRDIVGLSPDEAIRFFEGARKIFSQSILHDVGQFTQTMANLKIYHDRLYECKELHNHLDDILKSLSPFSSQIDLLDKDRKPIDMKLLRNLWRPVSAEVDSLLDFASTIKQIGKPYEKLPDTETGERWAIDIHKYRRAINHHLKLEDSRAPGEAVERPQPGLFQRLAGSKPDWWEDLYEQTQNFGSAAFQHMHETDKKLRATATQLYELSVAAFGGEQNETTSF